ncbi:zinc ribbon domain-containing protein [candidate division KSB1 bacterium]|nr:zinc ribbon domain-containing protein [candidate division KSB1 bacterium]
MPTYEYKCTQCKLKFERFQNMSDKPVSECPQCNGKVERLLSGGTGFLVKNSQPNYGRDTCCSMGEGCDNPKRCCERQE